MDDREHPAVDTKDRILDAAERLFAANGFRGTSIKQLAREARVNQAAMNYHFGSKAGLIEKVIERRANPLNRQRKERLEAVRQGCRPRVKEVLRAFIEPTFTQISPLAERKYFLALAGRAFFEPDSVTRQILEEQFRPTFLLLRDVMHEALPDLPPEVLLRRLHFAMGAMAQCLHMCSTGFAFSDLAPPANDLKTALASLLAFATSGLCAPVRERSGHEHP